MIFGIDIECSQITSIGIDYKNFSAEPTQTLSTVLGLLRITVERGASDKMTGRLVQHQYVTAYASRYSVERVRLLPYLRSLVICRCLCSKCHLIHMHMWYSWG